MLTSHRVGGLLMLLMVSGCADNPPAPIETRGKAATASSGATSPATSALPDYGPNLVPGKPYTVQKGDTLYAIAFRLGMDYRSLAGRNEIPPPYTIFPGQRLQTDEAKARPTASQVKNKPVEPAARGTAQTASKPPPKADQSPGKSSTRDPAKKEQQVVRAPPPTVVPPTAKKAPTQSSKAKPSLGPVSRWLWPGSGVVERPYSDVLHKGIDIAGQRGDPVFATAPGVVVYAGTGVKGYGALLIVKHNEQFLSAYGHNDAMLVAEGASVDAGQQIARMGSSGTDTVKLHFEIRRQGQPVDPLRLLPRR